MGASRWIFSVFSISTRSGRMRRLMLASGATGEPRRPARVGREISLSRRGEPWSCFSLARAWLLISAIFTPCGHTWVQMPQLEQRSSEWSGDGPYGARKRSACGPTYFGPGKRGVAAATGQCVSQIVHLTQWSSESRISSSSVWLIVPP
jgi:hypothetical protein